MATHPKWTDEKLALPLDAAQCFLGKAELKPLSLGDRIYRLRTNRQDKPGNAINESPWWFPKETYDGILSRAEKRKLQITTAARSGLAVPKRFNEDFDTLVICRLTRSGFCYRGPAFKQRWGPAGEYYLPGGFEQLWIPGLHSSDFRYEFFGNMTDRV